MVEYLKVLSLSVEPAYASLSVEPPVGSSPVGRAPSGSSPGGRATKVPLLISRAPCRVLAFLTSSKQEISIYLLGGGALVERAPHPLLISASLPAHHGSGSSRFREKRGEWIQSVVPHPIRSRERECIYYICYYAMNDRSISSPQFKRLVDEPARKQNRRA
jgi:hypothetical protein